MKALALVSLWILLTLGAVVGFADSPLHSASQQLYELILILLGGIALFAIGKWLIDKMKTKY